jgi:hypothetical protein
VLRRAAIWLLCLWPLAAQAQLWPKTKVVVTAGSGIGPVVLGKKLSEVSRSYLGSPNKTEAAGNQPGSGFALFGKGDNRDLKNGLLIRLNEGDTIHSVQAKGIRAATREGVYLGGPAALVSKRYPEAQQDTNSFTRQPEFCLPGLLIRTVGGKVDEFVVESKERTRWRFSSLLVVPGQRVGPFELNKNVPEEALKKLGPPTVEVKPGKTPNSGLLRWAIAGQNPSRVIEVVLHNGQNPRAVVSVRVRGVQAQTDQKIKLGDTAQTVRDLYPDGREGVHPGVGDTWRVPGANFVISGGRLTEMFVYSSAPGRPRR